MILCQGVVTTPENYGLLEDRAAEVQSVLDRDSEG